MQISVLHAPVEEEVDLKILIIGAGEVGFHIAARLAHENKEVVVIDNNSEVLQRVSDNIDVQVIEGSGSNPVVLKDAGLYDADILLAVTDSDEVNLVASMAANILSPSIKKLVRIRDAGFDDFHETFSKNSPNIDTIINPEIEVVKTIEQLIDIPGIVDISEFVSGKLKFIGVRLSKASQLDGIKLSSLPSVLNGNNILISAIFRDEKLIIPQGTDRLCAGDLIYFISEEKNLRKTLHYFGKDTYPVKRVLIIGGGRIGSRLAKSLEKKSINIKIIEKNPKRCSELAEELNKSIILHGDGTDQNLLVEENISDMDMVVTLTNDEETNIVVSLLSKRLGVKNTITKISKFSYFPLMHSIGIEQVVSPRLSAINTILQHIRKGKILSAISIKGEQAEVLEAVALPTSDIIGKPLKNMAFPKGAILVGIVRNDDIIIPSGDSIINPHDRIIIFSRQSAIPDIEKFLTVKLEYYQ